MTILLPLFLILLTATFFVLVALFRPTPSKDVFDEIMCPWEP